MGVTQPAELQEKGPSSPLPALTKARGKTLYLPLTATSTDCRIQQLNWISSLDRVDSGRRRECGKKRRQMRRSISFQPPFHFVLKRTSRRSEEAHPARLAVLMLKMAPVTNYRTEIPGASMQRWQQSSTLCHQRLPWKNQRPQQFWIKKRTFAVQPVI